MAASPPDVTVCIPAYEAADFVEDVLRCVQQQTHARLRVNVSVDYARGYDSEGWYFYIGEWF